MRLLLPPTRKKSLPILGKGGWGPDFLSDPLPNCQLWPLSNSWMAFVQYAQSIPPWCASRFSRYRAGKQSMASYTRSMYSALWRGDSRMAGTISPSTIKRQPLPSRPAYARMNTRCINIERPRARAGLSKTGNGMVKSPGRRPVRTPHSRHSLRRGRRRPLPCWSIRHL